MRRINKPGYTEHLDLRFGTGKKPIRDGYLFRKKPSLADSQDSVAQGSHFGAIFQVHERVALTGRVCWSYSLEGTLTQESIGHPLWVKPWMDANGLTGGLMPFCLVVCRIVATFGPIHLTIHLFHAGYCGWRLHNLVKGNQTRRGCGATSEGKTLQGEPRKCQGCVIKPQGSLRSKPPGG
jgi:hypothetical protein